ncbi:hypothetical protein [Kitasatospora sp. NPDC017646]|uniref:hypothetical protein n=1 Tax=Kitasatospora sp. NPDC017646 TaxID=3364024 RepID=UPI00378F7B5D
MSEALTTVTSRTSWQELLEDVGETYNGCDVDDVTDSEGRPEAAAWLAGTAMASVNGLAALLTSPWALHTPEQAGAVAAALTTIQHHAEQAKSRLLDVLEAMEERGDVSLPRFDDDPDEPIELAADLFKLEPSPRTADHLFAQFSSIPLLRPMPSTFAEALHQTAELLADLVVPGTTAEIFEDPDDSQHQGFVQIQHQGKRWRLFFHAGEEEWSLDDYPRNPVSVVTLGRFPLLAAHPARIAGAARTTLVELATQA